MRHPLIPVVFLAGLLALGWIGFGYLGSHPLALAVILLIGLGYLAGAGELYRYRQATATLRQAIAHLPTAPPTDLTAWLAGLHPSLRTAVRLRIEGERAALPAPALTPYLVGLLVLLGMLGTLLGMMNTLKGTGLALEGAADLATTHALLAAPLNGLSLAFGTSIAGVAGSAMLGLLSALCRRERLALVQQLDTASSTHLHVYSQAHQREQTLRLLQQHVELMPTLVDRLHTMMTTLERQHQQTGEQHLAHQHAFHQRLETTHATLAASVESSLKQSVADSAQAASAALQPLMRTTLTAITDQSTALHNTVMQAVQAQLQGLSHGFAASTATVAERWQHALAEQGQSNTALVQTLQGSLEHVIQRFEQNAQTLLAQASQQFETNAAQTTQAWQHNLAQQTQLNQTLAQHNQQALEAATAHFQQHADALLDNVQQSHAHLQATLQTQDQQRLSTWTDAFTGLTHSLAQQWQHTGEQTARYQQDICDTLARTAQDIGNHTQEHARQTLAEISRLVQTASEAPKAAAEVVAELRQKLSDSMVRDTAMLEERRHLLTTLETLLNAVNHASTEQRTAIDALVTTSSDLMERVGNRFSDHLHTQTEHLNDAASQVTASAVEMASLGDAFAHAVHQFGQCNDRMAERLQSIETALEKSLLRSDEQLAYYVAQAREVIDLSLLSQRQIIEDMHQLAGKPPAFETAST